MDLLSLRQAVLGAPDDAVLRLTYARALLDAGHRAAAWHEVLVAEGLGVEAAADLRRRFNLENPAGVVWTFAPLAVLSDAVAPAKLPDPRYPGVAAANGKRPLPLLLLLGRHCTECDESGVGVCTDCGGTGWRPSLLGDDDEPCPERCTCTRCGGSKYLVNVHRAAAGDCPHAEVVVEAEGSTWRLDRCTACGLGSMSSFPLWSGLGACGECGLFDCSCGVG